MRSCVSKDVTIPSRLNILTNSVDPPMHNMASANKYWKGMHIALVVSVKNKVDKQ